MILIDSHMKEFYLLNLFHIAVILSVEKCEIYLFRLLNILILPPIELTTSTVQKATIPMMFRGEKIVLIVKAITDNTKIRTSKSLRTTQRSELQNH